MDHILVTHGVAGEDIRPPGEAISASKTFGDVIGTDSAGDYLYGTIFDVQMRRIHIVATGSADKTDLGQKDG